MNNELQKEVSLRTKDSSAKNFPRFQFALGNTKDIVLRYKSILSLNANAYDSDEKLTFYLFDNGGKSKNTSALFLDEIVDEMRDVSLENFMKASDKPKKKELTCFVLPSHMLEKVLTTIDKRASVYLIVVKNDQEFPAISRQANIKGKENIFEIRTNDSCNEIDTVLENWMFQSLKPVCAAIIKDIEANNTNEQKTFCRDKTKRLSPKREPKSTSERISNMVQKAGVTNKDDRTRGKPFLKQDDDYPNEDKILRIDKETLKTFKPKTKANLLEEIVGLFYMSDVSTDDMEIIAQQRDDIDLKELSKQLFSKFEFLHGIGFRLQILHIFVKDGKSLNTVERQSLRDCLHKSKIHENEYEIVPISTKKFLTSGDEIEINDKRGSFGCFAKPIHNDERLFGLFSKHVAFSKKLNDKEGVNIGSIIPDTATEGKLDIAAATLSISTDECETRFKSVEGKVLPQNGIVAQNERLLGQKVHIWGTSSKPGKGIITMSKYIQKDIGHLILVEDIINEKNAVDKRFAKPGDSGAIACTGDRNGKYVNPVSVVVGCINYDDVVEDNENKVKQVAGQYLTLPLQSCLDEIGSTIGEPIKLC